MLVFIIFIFLSFTGYTLAKQDWKTTEVNLLLLLFFLFLSVNIIFFSPLSGTSLTEHIIGGVTGGGLGYLVKKYMDRKTGQNSFGEADIYILFSGGLLIGIQWLPILLIGSVFLGLCLFFFHKTRDGGIIPFLPSIFIILGLILWGRYLNILPNTIL